MAVFQVPASKASIKQNVFEFQIPGSKKVWSIPKAAYVNNDLLLRMREQLAIVKPLFDNGGNPTDEQTAALNAVQFELIDHYCPGVRKLLDSEQVKDILTAWGEASNEGAAGVGLGES